MAQPVISYPGAKWKFYNDMREYFPDDMEVFIEPFFGGGSVSLSVADDQRFSKLQRMIGGDLYTEMWSLWQGIKTNPDAVVEIATQWFKQSCPHQEEIYNTGFVGNTARSYMKDGKYENFRTSGEFDVEQISNIESLLKLYEVATEEGKNFWNWSQSVDTSQLTLEQRAARMLLVNKISFSGMGDAGSLSKDQFCDFTLDKLQLVYPAHRLLQRIELYNVSFEDTMKFAEDNPEKSFIFLDPPYFAQEGSGLYGKGGSTHKGFPHQHFAEHTKTMKCKWFVTYDDSVAVRKLFSGTTADGGLIYMKPYKTVYTMAGKTAEDALKGEELFISNYDLDAETEFDMDNF